MTLENSANQTNYYYIKDNYSSRHSLKNQATETETERDELTPTWSSPVVVLLVKDIDVIRRINAWRGDFKDVNRKDCLYIKIKNPSI